MPLTFLYCGAGDMKSDEGAKRKRNKKKYGYIDLKETLETSQPLRVADNGLPKICLHSTME